MYLSRLMLDTERRSTMRALASPQVLHAAVERSFIGERQRNLWRVDLLGDKCYLLILSTERPDFFNAEEQFGYQGSEKSWDIKEYDPLLARLQPGQVWRFRLRANPVRSSSKEKDKLSGRGKVFAHVTYEQQKLWLLTRSEECGLSVNVDSFDIVQTEWMKFQKSQNANHNVSIHAVTYEGILTIMDLERFKHSLTSGIGRAKAYGCGLLTIARNGGHNDG